MRRGKCQSLLSPIQRHHRPPLLCMARHNIIHRITWSSSKRGRWINIASCSNSTSEVLAFATIPKWLPIPAWVLASRGNGQGLQMP